MVVTVRRLTSYQSPLFQSFVRSPVRLQSPILHHQFRTLFDAFLKSSLGDCPLRTLSHTKTIPHSSSSTFKAVADVSGYPTFLPFTLSSEVTARDDKGYPAQARLKIGYAKFGLEELWDSRVKCDAARGTVEAQSSEENSNGLFEVLKTRWQIEDSGKQQTRVRLDVDVKFRNAFYDQMFAQVESKVAHAMITAFEKKVRETEATQS